MAGFFIKRSMYVTDKEIEDALEEFSESGDVKEVRIYDKVLVCNYPDTMFYYLKDHPDTYHEGFDQETDYMKLYMDIDGSNKKDSKEILKRLDELVILTLKSSGYSCKHIVHGSFITEDSVHEYMQRTVCMSIASKLSLHIIYPKILFKPKLMKEFMERLTQVKGYDVITANIDLAVYRKGSMRTVWGYKENLVSRMEPHEPKTHAKSADYFIYVFSKKGCIEVVTESNNLDNGYEAIIDAIAPNEVLKKEKVLDAILKKTKYFTIEVKYITNCSLCGARKHDNGLRCERTTSQGREIFTITKFNGGCATKKIVINKDRTRRLEKCFELSTSILADAGLFKDQDTNLWQWKDNRWSKFHKSELGTLVMGYNLAFPEDCYYIQNSQTRKFIANNLYDGIPCKRFLEPPRNYIMLKNGLFDIDLKALTDNGRKYKIDKTASVTWHTVWSAEEDAIMKELQEEILDKFMPKDSEFRVRFEELLGMMLVNEHRKGIVHLMGDTDAGKSLVLDIIFEMLSISKDGYGVVALHKILQTKQGGGPSEEIAMIADKIAVEINELEEHFIVSEARLKELTQQNFSADKKFGEILTYPNKSIKIVDSNWHMNISSVHPSSRKRVESIICKSQFLDMSNEEHRAIYEARDPKHHIYQQNPEFSVRVNSGYYSNAIFRICLKYYHQHHHGKTAAWFTSHDASSLASVKLFEETKMFLKKFNVHSAQIHDVITDLTHEHMRWISKKTLLMSKLLSRKTANLTVDLICKIIKEEKYTFKPEEIV